MEVRKKKKEGKEDGRFRGRNFGKAMTGVYLKYKVSDEAKRQTASFTKSFSIRESSLRICLGVYFLKITSFPLSALLVSIK